jgi:hypothetical protein
MQSGKNKKGKKQELKSALRANLKKRKAVTRRLGSEETTDAPKMKLRGRGFSNNSQAEN